MSEYSEQHFEGTKLVRRHYRQYVIIGGLSFPALITFLFIAMYKEGVLSIIAWVLTGSIILLNLFLKGRFLSTICPNCSKKIGGLFIGGIGGYGGFPKNCCHCGTSFL